MLWFKVESEEGFGGVGLDFGEDEMMGEWVNCLIL